MKGLITRGLSRSKAIWSAGGLTAAALAATATLAFAQAGPKPDGGPPEPPPGGNPVKVNTCGPSLTNIVRTNNVPSFTNATAFQVLPGAVTTVNVPDGASRCIKVLFTAETACGLTGGPDLCYVQATIDGAPMDPDGQAFQAIQSEDGSAEGNAYEWIERVGEGQHVIAIERRVQNAATPFYTDDWTFDVEVHN